MSVQSKEIIELGKTEPDRTGYFKNIVCGMIRRLLSVFRQENPIEELFDGGYDIDHILPYSITFDDSYRNKVLVTAQEKPAEKGIRTPYEYFGADEKRWEDYETSVRLLVRDYKKQQKLLKKNFTEEERKEFKERNLNDTKYITRVVYNMIRQNLELEPFNHPEKKKAGVGSQWSSDILPQKTLGTDAEKTVRLTDIMQWMRL